jgi:hypothetical protein
VRDKWHCVGVIVSAYTTYEDETECSEMSAFKFQTLGNHPRERIQHSEHGESLKSRIFTLIFTFNFGMICKEVKYLIRMLVVLKNLIIVRKLLELK